MDKVEKYASLYELPRSLEDAIKLFYTLQYKKKIGANEMVRTVILTSCCYRYDSTKDLLSLLVIVCALYSKRLPYIYIWLSHF